MTAILETLATDELVANAVVEIVPTRPSSRSTRTRQPSAPRKTTEEQWCSTLGSQDLRCLLSVIEDQLLPRMLQEYSAAHAQGPLPDPAS